MTVASPRLQRSVTTRLAGMGTVVRLLERCITRTGLSREHASLDRPAGGLSLARMLLATQGLMRRLGRLGSVGIRGIVTPRAPIPCGPVNNDNIMTPVDSTSAATQIRSPRMPTGTDAHLCNLRIGSGSGLPAGASGVRRHRAFHAHNAGLGALRTFRPSGEINSSPTNVARRRCAAARRTLAAVRCM